jgi:hypothetical protein
LRGGGGSIVWKTPDTALYSIYVGALWFNRMVVVQNGVAGGGERPGGVPAQRQLPLPGARRPQGAQCAPRLREDPGDKIIRMACTTLGEH